MRSKHSLGDGKVTLIIDKKPFDLLTTIKQEFRRYQVPYQDNPGWTKVPLLIVTERLSKPLREELREANVPYLEANGNFYLQQPGIFILIDGQPPYSSKKTATNRAFTSAGLRVIFHFLLDNSRVNDPYRTIAKQTRTSVGHIKNVITGLEKAKFLIQDDGTWRLVSKKDLLYRWIDLYDERLQPKLAQGTFRFAKLGKSDRAVHWQDLSLQTDKTYWGGEPAADLLTNHLRPGILTLYTSEDRTELMTNYRIVPDENGPIKIYQKFWYQEPQNTNIAPPLLVYADLMNQGDKRSRETADIICEQYLRDQF